MDIEQISHKRANSDAADLCRRTRASISLTFEGTRHHLVGKILETVRQDARHAIQSLHICLRNIRIIVAAWSERHVQRVFKILLIYLSRLVHGIKHVTYRRVRKMRRA